MPVESKARHRWVGGICLLTALAMLLAGETVLKDRLGAVTFAFYWLACFVLTALAALAAVREAARVRAASRDEQRALIESTLTEIEHERERRKPRS